MKPDQDERLAWQSLSSGYSLPIQTLLKQRRVLKTALPFGWVSCGTVGTILYFRNEAVATDEDDPGKTLSRIIQKTGIILPLGLPDLSEVCAL